MRTKNMWSVLMKSIIVISAIGIGSANQLQRLQRNHTPQRLTTNEVKHIAGLTDTNYFNRVIDNILIPRVVGTENHERVFNYITSELEAMGWSVEVDEFQANTPSFGRLSFKNIVGALNPAADRFLVLACHYDSKYFANEVFVGAIDSAVPCAMMLNLAKTLKTHLNSVKSRTDLSLKLIFFDGEEAFVSWGPKDSIYGARHLATKYNKQTSVTKSTGETVSHLQKFDMLVLLDLIGHKDANFYNYFPNTARWFSRMVEAENKLDNLGLLSPRNTRYFVDRDAFNTNIEDDHIPFLKKNVPILHLIPIPFPPQWHTSKDDRSIIDISTVENLNKILRIFVMEYLHASVTN